MKTKILTIVGARPQFIKAAVLSRAFKSYPEVEEVIVHTGQHFDENMSAVFFDEMAIPKPKYNLEIHTLGHGAMTGRMLEAIEEIIIKEQPDMVLVYGDTNTTLAGALAAKKLKVKLVHVEAGLRSFDMTMPEEINRILTDRISDLLLCPTDLAVEQLKNEGFDGYKVKFEKTGDVMQDAALFYSRISAKHAQVNKALGLDEFIIATLHRAENTNDSQRLKGVVDALNHIHGTVCPIVLPLHPRTKQKLAEFNLSLNVKVIDPVGYFDMIELIKQSKLVMTDSGGLQKEAYFFKKHCVTLREQTEWVELIEAGVNVLVGTDQNKIEMGVKEMLNKTSDFSIDLYGNGQAAQRSVKFILDFK